MGGFSREKPVARVSDHRATKSRAKREGGAEDSVRQKVDLNQGVAERGGEKKNARFYRSGRSGMKGAR